MNVIAWPPSYSLSIRSAILGLATIMYCNMNTATCADWRSFTWSEIQRGDKIVKHGAILLPVRLDGSKCKMQLDTGAGLSSLYRDALPRRYRNALNADSIVIERFELEDVASRSFKLMYTATRRTSNSCGARPRSRLAGTIANDYLLDKRLTLDLGRGLFRIEQGPFSPAEGQQHTSAPLDILTTENQGSFPVIKTVLGSGEEWKMGFDTGSASTSLVILSKKDWLNLVGLKSPEEAMSELVSRWGQQVPCYSAPIRTPIFVGTFKIDSKAEAVYCDDPRADPSAPNPIAGFIGLAPFGQGGVTIDYIGKNLYIFPRSDDAANSQKQK